MLFAETVELGLQETTPLTTQSGVTLNLNMVQQELLQIAGDGEPTGEVWYLDNGASNHMSGDRQKFRDIDSSVTGMVRFGDGSGIDIQGIGSIVFQGSSGDQWVLDGVYFIPKLRTNLICLGQLTEIGYRVVLDDDYLTVSEKNPHRLIMCVPRTANRMYKVELRNVEPNCLLASLENSAWLWHGRLGHVNFQSMKKLVEKEMAGGFH